MQQETPIAMSIGQRSIEAGTVAGSIGDVDPVENGTFECEIPNRQRRTWTTVRNSLKTQSTNAYTRKFWNRRVGK